MPSARGRREVVAVCAAGLIRYRWTTPDRVWAWVIILGTGYFLLVLFSNGLERFVVYARTVLPFTPFCCLVGGWATSTLLAKRLRWQLVAAVLFVGLAVWQLRRTAPQISAEIEIAVMKAYGIPKYSLTVSGSLYVPLDRPVTRPDLALINAQILYPIRGAFPMPAGLALLEFKHPLSYPPFQFESHTPARRAFFARARHLNLLDPTLHPEQVPADLPVALRYRTEERPTGR